jgi:hypothetical protein
MMRRRVRMVCMVMALDGGMGAKFKPEMGGNLADSPRRH